MSNSKISDRESKTVIHSFKKDIELNMLFLWVHWGNKQLEWK